MIKKVLHLFLASFVEKSFLTLTFEMKSIKNVNSVTKKNNNQCDFEPKVDHYTHASIESLQLVHV